MKSAIQVQLAMGKLYAYWYFLNFFCTTCTAKVTGTELRQVTMQ